MGKTQGLRNRVGHGHRDGDWRPVRALPALLGTVAFVTSALIAMASVAAQGPQREKGFQRILWLRSGHSADPAFFAAVRKAGFDALSVSGEQDPALPARHGLRFYRDQICGKGVFELRETQVAPLVLAYAAKRDDAVLKRPAVLSSTDTLLKVAQIVATELKRVLPHHPIAVSVGDEISVTRHANPLDFCFDPETLRDFRAFLRGRHRTIDRLNAAWSTDFASFDRVRPFTADAIRARELGGKTYPVNLAPWAAHREFMDRELARVVQRIVEQVGRADANLPCGLTGLQQPSAYGGHNYQRLLPMLSFYEAYDIGGARDLAMSFARPGARQIATLFPMKAKDDPRLVTARLADMVAHGMWGTVVWSSREVIANDGLTGFGRAVAAANESLRRAADVFAGAEMVRAPVWLVESQASVRAWWMLDSRRDGKTWIKRLSSYEATHSTSLATRHGWLRLFEDLGLQPRIVAASDLHVRLVTDPPRLLVLPATIALSSPAATAIEHYVKRGGIVLADHTPGLYDERLRLRTEPALDGLFGVRGRSLTLDRLQVHQGVPIAAARLDTGPAAAERGLHAKISDPVSGFHVQMERRHGAGTAFYLNLAVCEYGKVRLDPKRLYAAVGLRKRVRHILRQARVDPPVLVEAKGMPTCIERMVLQSTDGRRLLAVRVNALESPAVFAELSKRGPHEIGLQFRSKVQVVDLLTGEIRAAARRHVLPLDPYVGLFLELRRP